MKDNRIETMDRAERVLAQLAETGKISHGEYLRSIDDIRDRLNISEFDYMQALDGNWGNTEVAGDYSAN